MNIIILLHLLTKIQNDHHMLKFIIFFGRMTNARHMLKFYLSESCKSLNNSQLYRFYQIYRMNIKSPQATHQLGYLTTLTPKIQWVGLLYLQSWEQSQQLINNDQTSKHWRIMKKLEEPWKTLKKTNKKILKTIVKPL